ncbi:hypothetical protein B1A99_32160 [Cohnella sp. CIP 111063]|uniref:hypothetical protein n=1 Tax=unclassified Cohnella TaxID=2636738 RepID=UPI000B8BFC4B|nr:MULTISPECIES: hypothetical protein [unclassified Cohnella]OXS52849.1 hypothetical protein B1A99_32160 [Cohnella sp. CIP 111063]PRX59822.1 hypothetical protein B0G52_13032 [Cohnella sp. SGD-V74]
MSETTDNARWRLDESGIRWEIGADSRLPHDDQLEMSGRSVSAIVRYGVDEAGELLLARQVVWPMLRTIPNNTHASLMHEYPEEAIPRFKADGRLLSPERPRIVAFNGLLEIESETAEGLTVRRLLFPASESPALLETVTITNGTSRSVVLEAEPSGYSRRGRGVGGIYAMEAVVDASGPVHVQPGESAEFRLSYVGRRWSERLGDIDHAEEESRRREQIGTLRDKLRFDSPDPVLGRMFEFAKLRASESLFRTKYGLLHSPGGGHYYAAVWTNDQIEYAAPFFAYLGDAPAIEASLNAFRLYMPFMGPDNAPIPSSVISEGIDIWEGAGDRGDAAMYAYGASKFALATGSREIAEELWSAISWCLDYCRSRLTPEGVVASDSDELEGRFPTGSANLSTSALAFGGFHYASALARELGFPEEAEAAAKSAAELREAIEAYFGAEVEGFRTYRYYEGNDVLRSWIGLPLSLGITERKDGTIAAMLSPRLWTEDGLATQAGDTVFWDRSTLYGLRALFVAGETGKALDKWSAYSKRRLLGDHVPYAVEAYPEGNQRHLSAESALYGRIVTEGLFGISPTGLASFSCAPRLPESWPSMALSGIEAFGRSFDLRVSRSEDGNVLLTVSADGREQAYSLRNGEAAEVRFES